MWRGDAAVDRLTETRGAPVLLRAPRMTVSCLEVVTMIGGADTTVRSRSCSSMPDMLGGHVDDDTRGRGSGAYDDHGERGAVSTSD